jgi:hypothetical protein
MYGISFGFWALIAFVVNFCYYDFFLIKNWENENCVFLTKVWHFLQNKKNCKLRRGKVSGSRYIP